MNNEIMPIEIDFTVDDALGVEIKGTSSNIDLEFGDKACVSDYPELSNKPQINDVTLIGNKTSEELGLQSEMRALTVHEIERILYLDK